MEEFFRMEEVTKLLASINWNLVTAIILNIICLAILGKIIDKIANRASENLLKADRIQLAKMLPQLAKLVKIIIIFLAVAAFLQSQGYSVGSFLAGFGITGLAIGFAAQEAISDIFGSISVITDKVFRIGDYSAVGTEEGTVEDINFRSTRLRKLDDTVLVIPNRTVASSIIKNYAVIRNRVVDETFGVTYGTSNEKLQEAMEIIKNVALNDENVLEGFQVFIEKLNASSIDIRFIASLKTGQAVEMRKMKTTLILKVVEKFREAGIDFAFPSMSVYMEK